MKPPHFNPAWSSEVHRLYQHDMQEMWDPSLAPHIWNQYHNQLATYQSIARRLKPQRILDVGCAQGTLALLLAEEGYDVIANDMRPEFLEYAAQRYERGKISWVEGNVFDLNMNESFDLVFANQIIEHLVYPVEFLRKLATVVRPGGHIVIATPNHGYLKGNLPTFSELGDPALHKDKQFTADGDGHFFAYTRKELVQACHDAGFIEIWPFTFETPWISGHMKVRHLQPWLPLWIWKSLDFTTRSLPFIASHFCHQLGVIARKPLC